MTETADGIEIDGSLGGFEGSYPFDATRPDTQARATINGVVRAVECPALGDTAWF